MTQSELLFHISNTLDTAGDASEFDTASAIVRLIQDYNLSATEAGAHPTTDAINDAHARFIKNIYNNQNVTTLNMCVSYIQSVKNEIHRFNQTLLFEMH